MIKTKFYIAVGSKETAKAIRRAIVAAGHASTASWIDKPKPAYALEATRRESAAAIAFDDARRENLAAIEDFELREADAVVAQVGARPDAVGFAVALGKPVHLIGDRTDVLEWHALVVRYATLADFVATL